MPVANYTIVGDGDIGFGAEDVNFTAAGEVQSASTKNTGQKLELKNKHGNTFCVVYFDENNQGQIEVIWDQTYTIPERGDTIDAMGITDFLVDEVEKKWEQGKEAKLVITITNHPHVTIA